VLAVNSREKHVHRSSNARATVATVVAAIGMLGSNGLMAQATSPAATEPAPAAAGEIDEIVVTASKRAENLSKTPLAVSVLSQDQMTQQGITSTKDLTKEVPNLSLAVNGEGDAVVVNLRGIQSSNIFPDGDPAVAVYVDGVNIPRTQGLNGDLYDLARVEVLRGPQGTLYGRNATAGSINIITAPPTQTFAAHVDVSYGAFSDAAVHGFVNLPVNDTLALRVAFSVHRNDGYFDSHDTDRTRTMIGPTTCLDG
jgi:iron complex outermembrane receptor protein